MNMSTERTVIFLMNISQNFRDFRKNRNLTQKEMAEILGVSYQRVSQIEQGFRPPSARDILTIAEYFNCTTDEVYGLDKNRKEELK